MAERFANTGEPSPGHTLTRRQLLVLGASVALAGSKILQEWGKSSPEVNPRKRISLHDLATHGESLPKRTYKAGETIDWPTPIHIGHDWSLIIEDRPAIQLAHDLMPDGSVVNILSNNILRETPDKFGRDRNNLSLSDSTTMDDGVSVMRVRPALTTEKHIDYFDKITVEVKAPFYQYPNPDKAPSYQFQAPYRLNWYRGQRKETGFVDPEIETVVSERPLDPADYDNLDQLVRLFRTVCLGKTIAFITKSRKLHGPSDYYEANLEDTSGIVALNSYYLSADPRLFKLVINHEFNHLIISSAKQNVNTLDEIKNLRHVFRRLATQQN
ncbi:hypothetical protein KW794_02405, partial [Candidatus Saccharibacteria bacterium]|nr:hypothetical protein [Candidatus Saccharibacteria bacterium]